jgi:hypothetical protein
MSTVTIADVTSAVQHFVKAERDGLETIDIARAACFEVTIKYLYTDDGVR